eukprot:3653077-Karenia_brevis.AAC.1
MDHGPNAASVTFSGGGLIAVLYSVLRSPTVQTIATAAQDCLIEDSLVGRRVAKVLIFLFGVIFGILLTVVVSNDNFRFAIRLGEQVRSGEENTASLRREYVALEVATEEDSAR